MSLVKLALYTLSIIKCLISISFILIVRYLSRKKPDMSCFSNFIRSEWAVEPCWNYMYDHLTEIWDLKDAYRLSVTRYSDIWGSRDILSSEKVFRPTRMG